MKINKQIIGLIVGIAAAFALGSIAPVEPLTREAMYAIGFLVAAIIWMVTDAMPDYAAVLVMSSCWVIFGKIPVKTAFSTMSSSTFLLILGALGMGVAATKSGLMKRISLFMMRVFPANFRGQSLALLAAGLVTGPMIPSATAKTAIGSLARTVSDSLGYKPASKGSAGIFMSFIHGFSSSSPIFLSSSVVAYTMLGMFPEGTPGISWIQWFLFMLPWTAVYLVLFTAFIFIAYKPKQDTNILKESILEQAADMGPMSKTEKITAVVLMTALLCWILERTIGVSAAMTATLATSLLIILKVFDRKEFRSLIAWDSMIFLGCIVSVGDVFASTGVNAFIAQRMGPMIEPFMANIWVLVPMLCITTYIVRFAISAWTAAVTVLMSVMIPFCATTGIHPFVVGICIFTSVNVWNTVYQNVVYITARVSTGGEMATHKQCVPGSIAYMVINILGCMACIPLWSRLGFL